MILWSKYYSTTTIIICRGLLPVSIFFILLIPVSQNVIADGPSLLIIEPVDGSNFTTKTVVVRGCCTAPQYAISLASADLGNHSGTNMNWDSGQLIMQPIMSFNDDFNGADLDTTQWTFVRDSGITQVANGELRMENKYWGGSSREATGLIRSISGAIPKNMDWSAEFRVKFNVTAELSTGLGGGITPSQISYAGSTASINDAQSGTIEGELLKVYSLGSPVSSNGNDLRFHTVRLDYSSDDSESEIFLDGESLSTTRVTQVPDFFWFGATDTNNQEWMRSMMNVEFVRVWTYNGQWMSIPYDFGHQVEIDSISKRWTSSHMSTAIVPVEVSTSDDNISWSDWVPIAEISDITPALCRYLQLRLSSALPDIRDEQAHITIRSFDVSYRNPLVSVEVSTSDGEWMQATGLETWNATLELGEDMNVIQARVRDTSGAVNVTNVSITVDTTPPEGTVSINRSRPYLNDLNVTLLLNATDRYGIAEVQVSNAPDMSNKRTFPYSSEIPWLLEGEDGDVWVFVRFVDSHGLVSRIAKDSVVIDRLHPSGSISIEDDSEYTSTRTVSLDLSYNDNKGIATVEVSNNPDMNASFDILPPQTRIDNWDLTFGDDGPRTVYMRITDLAGNSVIVNSTIGLYIPKPLGKLTIEGGANITDSTVVDLEIQTPIEVRAGLMQLSHREDFEGAEWESVVRERIWILSGGDGMKTIYLRYEDFRGIVSIPVNASITLDTTPPILDVMLNGGAEFTTVSEVTATFVYTDSLPPSRLWLAPDERYDLVQPIQFAETVQWLISAIEGEQILYAKVEDLAGNTVTAYASIHYATILPLLTLDIIGGTVSSTITSIEVEAQVVDPYGGLKVQASFDIDPSDEDDWWPVGETISVRIPQGTEDGTYSIRGRAMNAAGLVSDIASVDVILDRTGPTLKIVKPDVGSTMRRASPKIIIEYDLDDTNGVSSVDYRIDDGSWTEISPTKRSVTVEFVKFGNHTVEVRAVDSVGNPTHDTVTFDVEKSEETTKLDSFFLIVLLVSVALFIIAFLVQRLWGSN
jgi:hypothetical protein